MAILAAIKAANGREALDRQHDVTPGVVRLDLVMPEMDGFELVETSTL